MLSHRFPQLQGNRFNITMSCMCVNRIEIINFLTHDQLKSLLMHSINSSSMTHVLCTLSVSAFIWTLCADSMIDLFFSYFSVEAFLSNSTSSMVCFFWSSLMCSSVVPGFPFASFSCRVFSVYKYRQTQMHVYSPTIIIIMMC